MKSGPFPQMMGGWMLRPKPRIVIRGRCRELGAAEETDHPRELIEAAPAHVIQNKVETAYARSDLFERRRRLMSDWAEYLSGRRGAEGSSPC